MPTQVHGQTHGFRAGGIGGQHSASHPVGELVHLQIGSLQIQAQGASQNKVISFDLFSRSLQVDQQEEQVAEKLLV